MNAESASERLRIQTLPRAGTAFPQPLMRLPLLAVKPASLYTTSGERAQPLKLRALFATRCRSLPSATAPNRRAAAALKTQKRVERL